MGRKHRRTSYVLGALLLVSMALGLVAGGYSEASSASAAKIGSGASAQKQAPAPRPQVIVVRVYFRDIAERDRLATEFGAEEVATLGGYLTVYADQSTYNELLQRGLRVEIDQEATRRANNPYLFGKDSPDTFFGGYYTVEEMQSFLDAKVTANPTLAQKVDFGDSWCKTHPGSCTLPSPYNGYDLWAMHITNQAIPGPKPVFWYDGAIHAREIAVPEVAMRLISWLLDNYNTNADAHWLVDYHDIWIVPMLNPDGHHIVEAGGASPYYQRKNSNNTNGCTTWPPSASVQFGTDNNRNFPFLWGCCNGSSTASCDQTYRGPSAGSDPETQAVMNQVRALIADQRGPNNTDPGPITATGVLQSMHSNAALDLYPCGWTGSP